MCTADGCVFQYTQQLPSCLSCNPYNTETSPPQLQLTLACGAQRTDEKKNQWTFDLKWFSNYSTNTLDHVPDVHETYFSNISVLVTSPAQYWCQVLDYTDSLPGDLLGRSNVAEVLSWEWYSSLPMCKGVQSVMESKCADLQSIPSPSPAMSKSPECAIIKKVSQANVLTGECLCMLYSSNTKQLFI